MKFSFKNVPGIGVLIAGLTLFGAGLWFLLSPAQYQAAVEVRVGNYIPGDPYFIQAEFEIVKSDIVLSNVVEKLDLFEDRDGQKVSMAAAIHRLKQRTTVQSVGPFTYILEIRVTDKNPETTTRVANAIAQAYLNYKEKRIFKGLRSLVETWQKEYQKQEGDLGARRMKVERLRRQLNIPATGLTETVIKTNYPAYFEAWRALTNEEAFQKELRQKIAQEEPFISSSLANMSIVTPAVPPNTPIGPNRALGMVLLICGLVISAFGFYLLSITVSRTKTQT